MAESSTPLVSILMTSYNREKFIGEAIESVLASSYTNWELIITDDCSKDNTVAIARKYEAIDKRIKVYINDKNLGDYPNRNNAASKATGKYLKYLDSDDMIYPYGLEVFVRSMERYPDAALGIVSRNPFQVQPFPIVLTPEQSYRKHFFKVGVLDIGPTGVIIRRDVFEKLGGFSGKRFVGDKECWFKIAALHNVLELAPSLIFWRQHEGQEYDLGDSGIDGGYFMMDLPLLRDVLGSEHCPLTAAERKQILDTNHHQYARRLIKHILKTGQVKKGLKRFSELQVSITDAL
jgi:glycosyltransferase involved in cell wall biosynthesis